MSNKVYKIKCSNGLYVSATGYGRWIEYTKKGKTWNSLNLVEKNLDLCNDFVDNSQDDPKYKDLKYTIEEIG